MPLTTALPHFPIFSAARIELDFATNYAEWRNEERRGYSVNPNRLTCSQTIVN